MKIFPLKPLSTLDKFKNLMYIMRKAQTPINEASNDKISLIDAQFTKQELRSVYKNALKMLKNDHFEKQ